VQRFDPGVDGRFELTLCQFALLGHELPDPGAKLQSLWDRASQGAKLQMGMGINQARQCHEILHPYDHA
jgi:hypothetical protein